MSSPCDAQMVASFDYSQLSPELTTVSKPAQRALLNHGVCTPQQLAQFSEREVLSWHGVGPSAIPKLTAALRQHGLAFAR